MSARDEILSGVRRALADADRTSPTVPRGYRSSNGLGSHVDLVALFVHRVEDYRATVVRCATDDVREVLAQALVHRTAVVPPGFPWSFTGAVTEVGQSARELDHVDGVVTLATVGIAETGTIVLDHSRGQGRRALSLVPDLHVCVIREDQIVRGVPEAVELLDPHRPQTWISGPSATSDIELTRVEGVHGPRTLHVIVVAP
jgi:L-lactate dehydrogenase complex protein LldG